MQEICSVIAQILEKNIEEVKFDNKCYEKDLTELGMDSIVFIHMIVQIEDQFEIEIPDEYLILNKLNTISKIAEIICQLKGK